MDYVTLNNGVKMPQLGYGVYQTPPEETERCVLEAIKNGYRSIDTAQAYGNEEGVGNAIAKCGLPQAVKIIINKDQNTKRNGCKLCTCTCFDMVTCPAAKCC